MNDPATIRAMCANLDPSNDAHWTSQGLPRMDVLEGMGLKIERRELNEALPGFNRTKAAEARPAVAKSPTVEPVAAERELTEAQLSNMHARERARRRAAAIEHLAKGGFSLKDLDPVASRLDQRIAARNRQARRELS